MPQKQLDTNGLIAGIVRLRRAERAADDRVRAEIEPVLACLEDIIGPTVGRADAARLLGVSHTALDRWIEKGEIAAVLTPRGRREIPLSQLVDLIEQVESRQGEDDRHALARVIRERRRHAEAIDEETFLPARRRAAPPRTHRISELHALAYHRLVARRLDERLVDDARKRLHRWRESGRIHPRWAAQWESVLTLPLPRIAKKIGADTEQARELRQTSPFAGALTEQERRRVLRAVEERVRA